MDCLKGIETQWTFLILVQGAVLLLRLSSVVCGVWMNVGVVGSKGRDERVLLESGFAFSFRQPPPTQPLFKGSPLLDPGLFLQFKSTKTQTLLR